MPDTVPGNATSTVDLAVGTSILGTIDSAGDHDWYRLTLVAGQRYSFATSYGGSASIDTVLVLRNAGGGAVASDNDGGPSDYSLVGYTATASGSYFIDVGTYNNATTGGFRLTVTSAAPPPGDLAAGDTSTTATIALGGTVDGTLEAIGDHDWYRVSFTAGQTYLIRTVATGGTRDPDTTIGIRDANGNPLVFNDDGDTGTYSLLRFTATTSGSYYIDVSSYGEAEAGAFRLTLAEAAPLPVYSNDQIAYQLTNVYFGGTAHHFAVAPGGTLSVDITGLTAAGQYLAREALGLWSDVTGLGFVEVGSGAQITYDDNEAGSFESDAVSRTGITSSARINISSEWLSQYGSTLNSYTFQAFVHETGHALGLGHAGTYNEEADYPDSATFVNDNWGASIMSYFSQTENDYIAKLGYTRQYQLTPAPADAIATTNLYGAATATRTGDTRYGFGNTSGRAVYDAVANPGAGYAIYDNGGVDTLDYSGFGAAQVINLTPESRSDVGGGRGNVSIGRGVVIENAIGGSGNDVLMGNGVANFLQGGAGNDTLMGGGGEDTLAGGTGNDTYLVDSFGDVVVEGADGDTADIVYAVNSYTLGADARVENFAAATAVATVGLALTGNQYGQAIAGGYGNDTLQGAGSSVNGGDILIGLRGDDLYLVDAPNILLIEAAGVIEGNDTATILASASGFVLNGDSYVENLVAASGTAAITITGNMLAQRIVGNDGANLLSTGGGGNDTLEGGAGDDVYRVHGTVTILDTGGSDTIYAGGSFRLNGGSAIEVISTAVQAGTEAIDLIGNGTAQTIVGNYGSNVLDGRGGSDTLIGLNGNDVFAFSSTLGADNIDTIRDFAAGDRIGLASDVFLVGGEVTMASFVLGTAAGDGDDRILYDRASGALFYDADGNGAGAAVQFAQLAAGTPLAASDFVVIAPVPGIVAL